MSQTDNLPLFLLFSTSFELQSPKLIIPTFAVKSRQTPFLQFRHTGTLLLTQHDLLLSSSANTDLSVLTDDRTITHLYMEKNRNTNLILL